MSLSAGICRSGIRSGAARDGLSALMCDAGVTSRDLACGTTALARTRMYFSYSATNPRAVPQRNRRGDTRGSQGTTLACFPLLCGRFQICASFTPSHGLLSQGHQGVTHSSAHALGKPPTPDPRDFLLNRACPENVQILFSSVFPRRCVHSIAVGLGIVSKPEMIQDRGLMSAGGPAAHPPPRRHAAPVPQVVLEVCSCAGRTMSCGLRNSRRG